jgi:hypothetical protein
MRLKKMSELTINYLRATDPELLLTAKELCTALGKSKAWAERHRWANTGIPYYRIGKTPYYKARDIIDFVDSKRVETQEI